LGGVAGHGGLHERGRVRLLGVGATSASMQIRAGCATGAQAVPASVFVQKTLYRRSGAAGPCRSGFCAANGGMVYKGFSLVNRQRERGCPFGSGPHRPRHGRKPSRQVRSSASPLAGAGMVALTRDHRRRQHCGGLDVFGFRMGAPREVARIEGLGPEREGCGPEVLTMGRA